VQTPRLLIKIAIATKEFSQTRASAEKIALSQLLGRILSNFVVREFLQQLLLYLHQARGKRRRRAHHTPHYCTMGPEQQTRPDTLRGGCDILCRTATINVEQKGATNKDKSWFNALPHMKLS